MSYMRSLYLVQKYPLTSTRQFLINKGIKPFYIGDIKVITNSPKPEPVSEFYNKAKDNTGMISPIIPAILPKYSRGYSYKNPDITVFL